MIRTSERLSTYKPNQVNNISINGGKMKKTVFFIFLFFLCAQIAGAADTEIIGDLFVEGSECVGIGCPSSPFDFAQRPLGLITLWVNGSAPYLLMRDADEGDFALFVDSDEFGIYSDDVSPPARIFGIDAAAPADSLFITSTGTVQSTFNGSNDVGDGLTVLYDMSVDNSAAGKVSDAGFSIENVKEDFTWVFRTSEPTEGFVATKLGTGGAEFRINNDTDVASNVSLNLANGASCSSTGQWLDASSRDYKENIQEITSIEALKTLKGLQPVKYNFKKDPSKDLTVGFIAEDVPDLVATKDKKALSPLEIVAVLTKVVQEQQTLVAKLTERINELEKE
jgi:hypothetical protein